MPAKAGSVIRYSPGLQPKQRVLLRMIDEGTANDIRFGGPKGGMKSNSLRTIFILLCEKYPGLRAEIWRRTTKDLTVNHIEPLLNLEGPDYNQVFNQQKMQLVIGKSLLTFNYAETEKDLRNQQGAGADLIGVDELSQWSETEIRILLKPRARRAVPLESCPQFVPKFVGAFNWGDVSHSYNKRVCIDREFTETENPKDFVFLSMYGWDNGYWSVKALEKDGLTIEDYFDWSDERRQEYFIERSDYGRALYQLPETARKQLLYGDPDVFEGMFFSMFSRKRNVEVVAKWKKVNEFNILGGLDYGSQTCLEVAATDYENRTTFFAEKWIEKSGAALRAYDLAEFLIEQKLWNLRVVYDTNMEFDSDDSENPERAPINIFKKIIKAKFQAEGLSGKEPIFMLVRKKSPNNKTYRVYCNEAWKNGLVMSQLMTDPKLIRALEMDGYPISEIRISENNPKLIESMTTLVHETGDHNGVDFDDKIGQDHAYDAGKMLYTNIRKAEPILMDSRPPWFRDLLDADTGQGWKAGMG